MQHFFNSNSNNMVDFTTLMSWLMLLTTCNNLRTFKVIKKEINREICQNCQPNKLAWSKKDQISLSGFCSTYTYKQQDDIDHFSLSRNYGICNYYSLWYSLGTNTKTLNFEHSEH